MCCDIPKSLGCRFSPLAQRGCLYFGNHSYSQTSMLKTKTKEKGDKKAKIETPFPFS